MKNEKSNKLTPCNSACTLIITTDLADAKHETNELPRTETDFCQWIFPGLTIKSLGAQSNHTERQVHVATYTCKKLLTVYRSY